ncbi:hypothetical protein KJ682_10160 [bacterium]|nr:hypothetical protein [bacterium]
MKINYHSLYPVSLLIALGAAVCPCPALGQGEVINDHIGLFADGYIQCTDAQFLDHVTVNVYMFCPSYPFINALELGLEVEGLVNTIIAASFPVPAFGDCLPRPTDPGSFDILAGYSSPLDAADAVHLASLDVFYLDTQPLYIRMTAHVPSSVGGDRPAYLAEPGFIVIPLTPLRSSPEDWDFAINDPFCNDVVLPQQAFTCGPLPATTSSWGAVKSLYR